ncbi:PREDICTED: protein G12-like [Nicrophorus vespilloides]|uniref:Protein G12-like n=1 Tax=Nicrophorus vespilloides TaxID=110193 RepID=A0ABM1M9A7_NICVS|nr:PREDICTED: protein G12-like [Nicrophorus vespilloides]
MKFALILIAICTLTSATLEDDFSDILSLFPVQEMRAIARTYLNSDVEFQRVVGYLQGPEWASLVTKVRENPTWKEFKAYLI